MRGKVHGYPDARRAIRRRHRRRNRRAISAEPGNRFYVRPFPEMNAYWTASCAYNRNGTRRDSAHSTLWHRKALARIAVVLRGGTRDAMNAELAQLGLPGVGAALPATTPKPRNRIPRMGALGVRRRAVRA
jgi:hypothetical protein